MCPFPWSIHKQAPTQEEAALKAASSKGCDVKPNSIRSPRSVRGLLWHTSRPVPAETSAWHPMQSVQAAG